MFGGRRFLRALACLVTALAVMAGACGDDGGGDEDAERATIPTAESTTTTEATTTTEPAPEFEPLLADPTLTPEEQVEAAYLYSWDIFLDALESGRTEHLQVAHTGSTLQSRIDEIETLVADGHRVQGSIDHDYQIKILQTDLAQVTDRATNHLVLTDADSGDALEDDPNTVVQNTYSFVLEDGQWRLAFIE